MSRNHGMVAVGAIACLFASGIAMAQNIEEVKVEATRSVQAKIVGRTDRLVPIKEISLTYGVSLAGIDLTSSAGAAEAERRVNDAALAACKDISRRYPTAAPDDAACARSAADEAMSKVQDLIAAAR